LSGSLRRFSVRQRTQPEKKHEAVVGALAMAVGLLAMCSVAPGRVILYMLQCGFRRANTANKTSRMWTIDAKFENGPHAPGYSSDNGGDSRETCNEVPPNMGPNAPGAAKIELCVHCMELIGRATRFGM
jgi:hypothetical protein